MATGLFSCGQSSKSTPDKTTLDVETKDLAIQGKRRNPLTNYPAKNTDTEYKYTDFSRKGVTIQNSLPKGGVEYTDSNGKNFEYVIFWNRVINRTNNPIELTINFPADSFEIFPSSNSYIKLFLPPDIMTLDKESLHNYGLTGLKSFLDTSFNKSSMVQRTMDPNEEYLFYVAMVSPYQLMGTRRAGFFLEEQDLFYRFRVGQDSTSIPIGQIIFKN